MRVGLGLVAVLGCAVCLAVVALPNGVAATSKRPAIALVSPKSGGAGTSVAITGSRFKGATAVKFNGRKASFKVQSASSIKATVPAGATSGKISVTTPGGTATSSASFTVIPTPKVTSFTPPNGPIGTSVTISGSNFTGATAIKFHGVASTAFKVQSAGSIKTTVPKGATTGTISVTTPGGTATSSASFIVIPAPTITSLTPASGQIGTPVTITGTNFTGATAVKFNGNSVTSFHVVSATSITTTVPAGETTGKVAVTTPGGTATSSGTFTVMPKTEIDECGTLTANATWTPTNAVRYVLTCTVTIPDGVALTIKPGTIIKNGGGIQVNPGATLNATGVAGDPVIFTSLNDNSVGGTTGSGSPQAGDYTTAISLPTIGECGGSPAKASVQVSHAEFRYGQESIANSFTCALPLDVSVTDSKVGGLLQVEGADATSSVTLTGNQFTGAEGGIFLSGEVVPQVSANQFATGGQAGSDTNGSAVRLDTNITGFSLSGPDSNTFSGTGLASTVYLVGAVVPADNSWEASASSGATLIPVQVEVYGTLTLDHGMIAKFEGGSTGFMVNPGATLNATGVAGDPVIFTSLNDNSVGGTTGSGSPQAGDYTTAILASQPASIDVEYAHMLYGEKAVDVAAGSSTAATVDSSVFRANVTALRADITAGANVAIHGDWFDGNQTAMLGSSDWIPFDYQSLVGCDYLPEMAAGGNIFGPDASTEPYLTQSDINAIEIIELVHGTEQYPEGWLDNVLAVNPSGGSSDLVTYTGEDCQPIADEPPHAVLASPFDFSQN